jgi:hypothetical protein
LAFGKKKDEAGTLAAADAADDDAPLFPDAGDESPEDAAASLAVSAEPAPEPAAPEEAPTPAEAPAPAAEAAPTDALLSMFQSSEGGDDDRSVLIEMAGDVELADLLEELNTLAAAMNVVRR